MNHVYCIQLIFQSEFLVIFNFKFKRTFWKDIDIKVDKILIAPIEIKVINRRIEIAWNSEPDVSTSLLSNQINIITVN